MGRGKQYTEAEDWLIAKAYAWATNNKIKGAEQKKKEFMERVLTYLKKHSPEDHEPGTFHERDVLALERRIQ
jgi:hypothetical protein